MRPSGPFTRTAFGVPCGNIRLASTTSSRAILRGLKTTTGVPAASVLSPEATAFRCVCQDAGKLVCNNNVVVPRVLICAGCGSPGSSVVEVSGQFKHPGVIDPMLRISTPSHPRRGNRRLLCCIGKQLILDDPALVIGL